MKVRIDRTFVAISSDGVCYHHHDPAEIAPWAAAEGEPVLYRIGVTPVRKGARPRVAAGAVRIPPNEDPTEYMSRVAEAAATRLKAQLEERG